MSKPSIKTPSEIDAMRKSGQILAKILNRLRSECVSGRTTMQINNAASQMLVEYGATSPILGYGGFPCAICISVNQEVIHGIPSDSRRLKNGDIVGLDFCVKYQGMITDAAITVAVGAISPQASKLIKVTENALYRGIGVIKANIKVGELSAKIESHAEGMGIVRDFVGHGVGHSIHEPPEIPNYGSANQGPILRAGMTIAVEPMFTLGSGETYIAPDGWTVVTSDNSLGAHFEHTVLITNDGCEILTIVEM